MKRSLSLIMSYFLMSAPVYASVTECLADKTLPEEKLRDEKVKLCLSHHPPANFNECENSAELFESYELSGKFLEQCFTQYSSTIPDGRTCKSAAINLSEVGVLLQNMGNCIDLLGPVSLDECMEVNTEFAIINPEEFMAKKCVAKLRDNIDRKDCLAKLDSPPFNIVSELHSICIERLELFTFQSCKTQAKALSDDHSSDLMLLTCLEKFKDLDFNLCMGEVKKLKISNSKFGGISICMNNRR